MLGGCHRLERGVLAGGGGIPRGGKHPPRPALRTLIVSGGRRRPPEGPCTSPLPARGLLVTPTIALGDRARGGARPCVLFSGLSAGGVRVFIRSHRCGAEPASRGRPRRPAPSRAQEGGREHPRRGRRGRFAAQLWSALGNFCPPPAGPIFFFFCRVVGLPCLPPIPAGVQQGRDGGKGLASRGWGTQCAPALPLLTRPGPPRPPAPTSRLAVS